MRFNWVAYSHSGAVPIFLSMDGCALFKSVLNPEERLMWSYQRQVRAGNSLKRFAIVASVLWLGSFMLLRAISGKGQHPIPFWLQMEVSCLAGFFFILPIFLSWLNIRWAQNTAYGLTDRRVLMAVGPRPEDIRALALTALGPVRLVNGPGGGYQLLLALRLPEQTFFGPKSVWTFPDTGKVDKRATPYWHVDDPTAVKELLENAKNAVWYPPHGRSA